MSEQAHTTKVNNSLVWKLAFSQVRRIFSVFLTVNLWLCIFVIAGLIYYGELQGYLVQHQQEAVMESIESPSPLYNSNTAYTLEGNARGITGPKFIEELGLIPKTSQRYLSFEESPVREQYPSLYQDKFSLFEENVPLYTVFIPLSGGQFLAVKTDLSHAVSVFATILAALIVIEIFVLVSSVLKAQRSITRTLRPIYELTAAAQSMSTKASDLSIPLSSTIDALDTITEEHLDRRIAISDERSELQGLAAAINNMLDRLDASYQAQLRFVSDASHELRTPIAIIQGYASLLERWGKDDPETLDESIQAIKDEAIGMQLLVEQLLFLARSDNQSLTLDKQEVDVSALMQEVVKETDMINDKHLLNSNIEPGLWVDGDPQVLKQGVRILIDNSIKYTPEDGVITVQAKSENGQVSLSVSDTGIGMTKQEVAHVFERFWRADEARNRKSGGTGLGLSIAKWIVDSHHGYLEIISRKGLGTKTSILLPSITPSSKGLSA